jgi:hypothetical protein
MLMVCQYECTLSALQVNGKKCGQVKSPIMKKPLIYVNMWLLFGPNSKYEFTVVHVAHFIYLTTAEYTCYTVNWFIGHFKSTFSFMLL